MNSTNQFITMKLILCKDCKKPLIEDIGDIEKCRICEKSRKCPSHIFSCKKCRLEKDCTKSEIKQCIGCMKFFDTDIKNPPMPKCGKCHEKSKCGLIELFCKDCLDIIHINNGLEGFISTFSEERQAQITEKIREFVNKKRRSNLLSDIEDIEL